MIQTEHSAWCNVCLAYGGRCDVRQTLIMHVQSMGWAVTQNENGSVDLLCPACQMLKQEHMMLYVYVRPLDAANLFFRKYGHWPAHIIYPMGSAPDVDDEDRAQMSALGIDVQVLKQAKLYCYVGPLLPEDIGVGTAE